MAGGEVFCVLLGPGQLLAPAPSAAVAVVVVAVSPPLLLLPLLPLLPPPLPVELLPEVPGVGGGRVPDIGLGPSQPPAVVELLAQVAVVTSLLVTPSAVSVAVTSLGVSSVSVVMYPASIINLALPRVTVPASPPASVTSASAALTTAGVASTSSAPPETKYL